MAGRRPTGVYTKIDPIPATVPTNVGVIPLLYMHTVKGQTLNRVTSQDWKDQIGFDLKFNPLYANMVRLMELTEIAYVVRLESGAYIDNMILTESDTQVVSQNVSSFDSLSITPDTKSQDIVFTVENKTIDLTLTALPSYESIAISNKSTGDVVGTVDSNGNVISSVLQGAITNTNLNITLTIDSPSATELEYEIDYITRDTMAKFIIGATDKGKYLKGNFTVSRLSDTQYNIVYVDESGVSTTYTANVDELFEVEYLFKCIAYSTSFPDNFTFQVSGGSIGVTPTTLPNSSTYLSYGGQKIDWNFTLSAGLSGDLLRQVFVESLKLEKTVLYGSPHFDKFTDLSSWKTGLTGLYDFASGVWSSEFVLIDNVEYYVDGSITRYNAYSTMYLATNEIANVPAGKLYGTLSGYKYTETDSDEFEQELVDLRISYVNFKPSPIMWNQWTDSTQSDNHPLSYLNSAVTVQLVRQELKTILEYQLFVLETTGGNIDSTIQANCEAYLQTLLTKGFLIDYTIVVSKKEARSRTVTVTLTCSEDVEIIDLVIEV